MEDRLIANSVQSLEYFFEDTPCWEWLGHINTSGYGKVTVRVEGRAYPVPRLVHRVSHETFIGPVPDGHVVMHRCNRKFCMSPLHLTSGTQSDNIKQCVAEGRHSSQQDAEPAPDWHKEF